VRESNRNAMAHTESYSYEPVPEPDGNDWLAVVEITKEHYSWRRLKCFRGVLRVESQREAYAKSMSLGHTISVWP
jgi:hypothetical protein